MYVGSLMADWRSGQINGLVTEHLESYFEYHEIQAWRTVCCLGKQVMREYLCQTR